MAFKIAKKRIPLNQLNHRFSCSIIGTCLSLKELKKLSRQIKLSGLDDTNEYDLHRIYVGIAAEKSYSNRRLQKLLDQKFQQVLKVFSVIETESELKQQWKNAQKTGDIAAVYWGLLTHPMTTEALIEEVYGDVHMLSHIAGASMRVDLHEFSLLRNEVKLLKNKQQQRYQKHSRTLYEKDALLRQHKKIIQKQQIELNAMAIAQVYKPQYKEEDRRGTQYKIRQLEQKVAHYQSKWKRAINQQAILERQLAQNSEELSSMESIFNIHLLSEREKSCSLPSKQCQHEDLEGQCILYVGGRDKQCQYFKPLVENRNGQFMHHDGGLSDGKHHLNSVLRQADVVMCPLDCISHEAMIKIKKHCKIAEKPLVMMPRSSLSAFSKGLIDVGKLVDKEPSSFSIFYKTTEKSN